MECNEVRLQFGRYNFEPCCESCHEDDSLGYGDDLWFTDPNDEDRNVCCAIARGFDKIKCQTT